MNLALHGFLLQVFVSILDFQHGSLLCSAGEPGYLDFDNLPETNFSCQGKVIGGYYADIEAGCQMFHVCTIGQKDEIMDIKFLCLNGTVFDQETRVCERVDEVDCSKSERFYDLNLELYGNSAVTLSLHEAGVTDEDSSDSIDDHQQRTTSARPTTTTTTTTTSNPSKQPTTPTSGSFSHPTGYPQHYQPQPPFPQVHTSQSKSLYDDKNGGYHHQYIFHNGERNNNQATSYQLFSNQGVSSTTVQPPQVHQIRFSSTASPQIIHNEPSTVAPLFHATSSTIQTLLNSNANSPAIINPIFHNHGIASTTEQFTIHNPRETSEYRDNGDGSIRPLEAIQSTNKGKVSKLTISPVPTQSDPPRSIPPNNQTPQQQRISGTFLPTPPTIETTIRSFYPTPRTSKPTQSSQTSEQVTQHIHVLPPVAIPHLKPQQITINLPPPDIQRIVQNPPPLLPSQSRVIVTAKASVSDESGRPLNTTQLVTLPLPTIPASYDDYKEGDETFDPFYKDVPKIRNNRRNAKKTNEEKQRSRRSVDERKNSMSSFVYGVDSVDNTKIDNENEGKKENFDDFKSIKQSLLKFRDILFSGEITEDSMRHIFGTEDKMKSNLQAREKDGNENQYSLEDLETKASKHFKASEYEDEDEDESKEYTPEDEESETSDNSEPNTEVGEIEKSAEVEETENDEPRIVEDKEIEEEEIKTPPADSKSAEPEEYSISDFDNEESEKSLGKEEESKSKKTPEKSEDTHSSKEAIPKSVEDDRVLDIVILDTDEYLKLKSSGQENRENYYEEDPIIPTEIPVIPTSEGVDSEKSQDLKPDNSTYKEADLKDSENSTKLELNTESANHPRKIEEVEKEGLKDTAKEEQKETKPTGRRKSSRIRSSKGRISARKKQRKDDGSIETSTRVPSMDSHLEKISSHIFNEPESQTIKEVDTRAVGNNRGKNLKESKGEDSGKTDGPSEVNNFEAVENHPNNLEKQEQLIELKKPYEESSQQGSPDSSINPSDETPKGEKSMEKLEDVEDSVMTENHSEEENSYKEESSHEEETPEYETATISSEEDKPNSEEVEKESSLETQNSSRGKSMKFEDSSKETLSHRRDKSRKFEDEENIESQDYSTAKSKEELNSEEVSEYRDSTEATFENTGETSGEDDYRESGSLEDTTMSTEDINSDETADSQEEAVEQSTEDESTLIDQEESTEGVLKFTDELPKEKKEDVIEIKKPSESVENMAQDYVDDNYEPENYKESESTDSNNLSDEKEKEINKTEKNIEKINVTEPSKIDQEENEETEPETKSEKPSDSSEIEAEPVTTTTTTTTTIRPASLKLFKPISARKVYNYIPPTTPPNPVIIKPRISLLNPKPAKPPKSYNELAPKPIIRKFSLLARKSTTTVAATTIDEKDAESTTEVLMTTTEISRSEENILEGKLETKELEETSTPLPPKNGSLTKTKDDQITSPSEQKSPNLLEDDSTKENFTPYPISRLSTFAPVQEDTSKEPEKTTLKSYTLMDVDIISTTITPITVTPGVSKYPETSSNRLDEGMTTRKTDQTDITTEASTSTETPSSNDELDTERPISTTLRPVNRKASIAKQGSFNCLEKEMYRFYGDNRDCRLFHYCSPGFTSRQVLDFRFVCEEGTAFDEESQSCRHNIRNRICLNKQW